ncbi:MAG: response regulator transcription factor, partial [Burkholderiales bacterium]
MLKILLVEDSAVVRQRLLQSIASIPNISVVGEYEDADAAIDAVRQHLPDVILLDLRLRTGSGISVLKETMRTHPSAKVVVFTNYTEPQYRAACLGNGAQHFFDKSN